MMNKKSVIWCLETYGLLFSDNFVQQVSVEVYRRSKMWFDTDG